MLLPTNRWNDSAPGGSLLARALYRATRVPTGSAVAAALAAVLAMAALDVALGTGWSLGLFYALPIAFAAWRLGRGFGLAASAGAALAWYAGSAAYGEMDALWGMGSRALSYGLVALLVAEMRQMYERERGLARHDGLTGALIGRCFRDVLDAEVAAARRDGRSLALVYTDLDDFKQVNDQVGHPAGDDILCAFAGAARAALGERDHLARTGGDEFVALLVGHNGQERAAVERLRSAVRSALAQAEHPLSCTMGAIIVPAGQSLEPGELVRRADAAMYEAKRAGKGGACVFEVGRRSPLAVAA